MARTIVSTSDPKAIKKQSVLLSVLVPKASFFGQGMIGRGPESEAFIQRIDDLSKDASGDEISVDLLMPSKTEPTIGSDTLDGNEEEMSFYTDKVKIDQVRHGTQVGDRMSRKRTIYDLRKKAMRLEKDYWARLIDEAIFIAASGVCPAGQGFIWKPTSKFWQVNQLTAPDSKHQYFGGAATSLATLTAADVMSVTLVEKLVAIAETMGGDTSDEISMVPSKIGGVNSYCLVMSPFQALSLRRSTNTGEWLDIQKAATTHEGRDNPIFKGGSALGMVGGVILKKHRNVIGQKGGAGGSVETARALMLAQQGVIWAAGDGGGDMAFSVTEEVKDHGDKMAVGTRTMFGVKKSSYELPSGRRDFGVFAVDTANPLPV